VAEEEEESTFFEAKNEEKPAKRKVQLLED
jgi:hypothetical protein